MSNKKGAYKFKIYNQLANLFKVILKAFLSLIAGWSSLVARWAHNPKVAGSNPAPATRGSNIKKLGPRSPKARANSDKTIFLSLIISFIFTANSELDFWIDANRGRSYNSQDYTKKYSSMHGIYRITTEYADGYTYQITYHKNGILKSKGHYNKDGLKCYDWKYCNELYSCYCEHYTKRGKRIKGDRICE